MLCAMRKWDAGPEARYSIFPRRPIVFGVAVTVTRGYAWNVGVCFTSLSIHGRLVGRQGLLVSRSAEGLLTRMSSNPVRRYYTASLFQTSAGRGVWNGLQIRSRHESQSALSCRASERLVARGGLEPPASGGVIWSSLTGN